MTTTQIYYTPPGNTLTARFDVTGSNVANVALTEVFSPAFAGGVNTYHTRNTNNYYEWICGTPDVAFANISMINWTPSVGNLTLVDYTFPNGGGTLSSTTSNISISGQWLVAREYITKSSSAGDAFYLFGLASLPAYSGGDLVRVNQAGAPGDDPVWDNSPINTWQNSAIQTYNITGNTDTFANTRFYANVKNQLSTQSGAGGPTQANVLIVFEYTYARSYEVNLHSTGSTITSDHDLTALGGIVQSAASELVVDTAFEPQAQNLTGFRFVDRGDGVHEGVIDGELYVAADYADTDYFTGSPISVSFTPDRPLRQEYDGEVAASFTSTVIIPIAMSNVIDVDFAAAAGRIQQATVDITIDAVLDDVVPGLVPGGSVQATIEFDSETTAVNRVFTLALDYVDPDYADTGYFEQGSSATGTFTTQIDLVTLADSSIVRSDGSISLEADLATTVIAGFQIDAGVILAADAALDIAPYITGGTGVIRAIAAELTDEFVVADLFLGQSVELQADLAIEFVAAGFAAITRGIQDQLEIALELSAQAIAAPPLLGTVTLEIDSQALAVPSLFPGFASPSILETGPSTVTALAGYTVSGQFAVTQGITADFVVAGSTFRIDDYFTSVVTPESRSIRVNAATGQITVDTETRVNTIQVETRGLVVDPETRRDRIAINPAVLEGNRLRRYNQ